MVCIIMYFLFDVLECWEETSINEENIYGSNLSVLGNMDRKQPKLLWK